DVRGDQDATGGIEREPVRLDAYGDLEGIPLVTGREYRDGVLATIAREDETVRFGDERTCHSDEAGYRFNVPISRAVDDVDGIVVVWGDVGAVRGLMNIRVIDPAIGLMGREFDVAQKTKCHRC